MPDVFVEGTKVPMATLTVLVSRQVKINRKFTRSEDSNKKPCNLTIKDDIVDDNGKV